MNRHSISACLLTAITSVLITACASTANVDYDKSYDFSRIHDIQLIVPEQPTSRDTRINSPLVAERVNNAIIAQLTAQGYRVVDTAADVTLRYQLSTRGGVDSYGSGVSFGFGHFGRHTGVGLGYDLPGYGVDSYDESVLTIDVQAVNSDELLWRGSSARRLTDGLTPAKLDAAVDKLVSETLVNFPPGKK